MTHYRKIINPIYGRNSCSVQFSELPPLWKRICLKYAHSVLLHKRHDYVSYESNNKPLRMAVFVCVVMLLVWIGCLCTCVGLWVIILTNHEAHQLIGQDAGGDEGHPQSDVQLLSDLRLNPHKQTDVHIRTQTSTQTHTNMEKHSLVSFRS